MRTYSRTVKGEDAAKALALFVIGNSQWVAIEPRPDGEYSVSVKEENRGLLHSMAEAQCGGWINFETFDVNRYIRSDSEQVKAWEEIASLCYEDQPFEEDAVADLAVRLRDDFRNGRREGEGSPYANLLERALDRVDWHAIAKEFIDAIVEREKSNEEPLDRDCDE